jgi:hypothetical protein
MSDHLSSARTPAVPETPIMATRTTNGTLPIVWKISAGALIPAIATIIFNVLNFFFENYQTKPLPQMQHSVFDVGVGCAFSLVGICVTAKRHSLTNSFLLIFVALLLTILGGQLLALDNSRRIVGRPRQPQLTVCRAARCSTITNALPFAFPSRECSR